MSNQFEIGVVEKFFDIWFVSSVVIVQANDFFATIKESFTEIGAEKSGTAGDQVYMWHD